MNLKNLKWEKSFFEFRMKQKRYFEFKDFKMEIYIF